MASLFQKVRIVYYNFRQQRLENRYAAASDSSAIRGYCLMYHHISDEYIDGVPSTCQCTELRFQQSLLEMIERGYEPVSIKEALRRMEKKERSPFFIVTFDDIPVSVYEKAFPFLKEHNVPFAVFIATSLLNEPGYVSTEQLRELAECPLCTVGAHTKTHAILRGNQNKESDLLDSKMELERTLNRPVQYLAYPYGSVQAVDRKSISIAKKYFDCAFSTVYSDLNDCSVRNKWFLPRIFVK